MAKLNQNLNLITVYDHNACYCQAQFEASVPIIRDMVLLWCQIRCHNRIVVDLVRF